MVNEGETIRRIGALSRRATGPHLSTMPSTDRSS
jgi:hypothetical protein